MFILTGRGQDRFVVSVSPSAASWASVDNPWVEFPAEGGEKLVKINTNLTLQVSSRPIWLTSSFVDKTTLKLVAKSNSSKKKRQNVLVLKGKDGKSVSLTILQFGSTPNAVANKTSIPYYGDKQVDSFIVSSNVPYTLEYPEWLKEESNQDGRHVFSAKKLYDQSKREGVINIKDASGNIMSYINVDQKYHNATWFEKPSFAVISDIHLGDETYGQIYSYRMPRVINTINKHDPPVSNVIVIGDLADHGYEDEYRKIPNYFDKLQNGTQTIFMRGNHDNLRGEGKEFYTRLVHPEVNRYIDIKGYPFITLSCDNSVYRGDSYDPETLAFLSKSLAAADRDYPGKPIFVFSHLLPRNTLSGSYPVSTGDLEACADGLDEILSEYPQVIHFSGHTHRNISLPRQIYQKNYTAVNDGSQKRDTYGGGYNHLGASSEVDYDCITEGLFVHISDEDDVVIERWNTSRGINYEKDWVVSPPFDGSNFTYMNRDGGKAPWWPEGSELKVSNKTATSCHLTFPQAIDDAEGVYYYRIDVVNEQFTKVMSTLGQSALQYMGPKRPDFITVPLSNLPTGVTLKASVYARDYYDLDSPKLEVSFKLE